MLTSEALRQIDQILENRHFRYAISSDTLVVIGHDRDDRLFLALFCQSQPVLVQEVADITNRNPYRKKPFPAIHSTEEWVAFFENANLSDYFCDSDFELIDPVDNLFFPPSSAAGHLQSAAPAEAPQSVAVETIDVYEKTAPNPETATPDRGFYESDDALVHRLIPDRILHYPGQEPTAVLPDMRRTAKRGRPQSVTAKQLISLRIETHYIEKAKGIAQARGIGYQTLFRMWILEKLGQWPG